MNYNHSWAKVELYRWQHGELPPQDGKEKPLSIPAGLRGMAKAIQVRDENNFPTPQNVMSVLNFVADILENPKQ